MEFKFGFEVDGIRYGWNLKKLYKLPLASKKRSYSLREVLPHKIGDKTKRTFYTINLKKMSLNKLRNLTKQVDWKVDLADSSEHTPF